MATFPVVVNQSGYVPQPPATLWQALLAAIATTNPGYTANLPSSLVEDISSTDVYALVQCDSSVAELVNSLTPYGANAFLLNQLGSIYGVQIGQATNTSVYVQFTGPAGFVVAQGFTVTDGTYQYTLPNGGVIGTGGVSLPLYAIATVPGSWAVAAGTVSQLVTSVPSSYSVTVNNPLPGLPATGAETLQGFRSRVLRAGLAASQGMARYLRTLLQNIPGVQARLVSVKQISSGSLWEVICGGGDQYQVAYAIYYALFDINALQGSILAVEGITLANPGVVTTTLNHGYASGQAVGFTGIVGMTNLNIVTAPQIIAVVLTETTFSLETSGAITSMVLTTGTVTVTTIANLLGLTNGDSYSIIISGVTPSAYNGTFTCLITGVNTFTYSLGGSPGSVTVQGAYLAPLDTRAFTAWSSGGVVTPNFRNVTTSLLDYPDTYSVTFVNPPQQTVAMTVTWNTISTNYVNPAAIAQLANPALVNYVNSVVVGQPMNLFELQTTFQAAVSSILPAQLLTRMVFAVDINGIGVSPISGTGEIVGDPESYFETNTTLITINQG